MNRKQTILVFDDNSTKSRQIFEEFWRADSSITTQTATEENLVDIEKNDNGAITVYIGDDKTTQQRLEVNGGTYLSSATFCIITQVFVSHTANQSSVCIVNNSVISRINAGKIKKLNRLGIYFRNKQNDIQ